MLEKFRGMCRSGFADTRDRMLISNSRSILTEDLVLIFAIMRLCREPFSLIYPMVGVQEASSIAIPLLLASTLGRYTASIIIRCTPCWIPGVSNNESETCWRSTMHDIATCYACVVAKQVSVDSGDVVNTAGLL